MIKVISFYFGENYGKKTESGDIHAGLQNKSI